MVDVKVYSNKLKMYYNNQPIGEHERSYEMYQWQIKLEHYLKTLRASLKTHFFSSMQKQKYTIVF